MRRRHLVGNQVSYSRAIKRVRLTRSTEALDGGGVAVATERVRQALDTAPDEDLPLLVWLQAVARQQLNDGLLLVLGDLHGLAEQHPPLRPHLLEFQRCIRETAREAVLARLDGQESQIQAHLLVGAAYGALTCVLDGQIPVRLPATATQTASDADAEGAEMTLEDWNRCTHRSAGTRRSDWSSHC